MTVRGCNLHFYFHAYVTLVTYCPLEKYSLLTWRSYSFNKHHLWSYLITKTSS